LEESRVVRQYEMGRWVIMMVCVRIILIIMYAATKDGAFLGSGSPDGCVNAKSPFHTLSYDNKHPPSTVLLCFHICIGVCFFVAFSCYGL
jgi:hypothetical protein